MEWRGQRWQNSCHQGIRCGQGSLRGCNFEQKAKVTRRLRKALITAYAKFSLSSLRVSTHPLPWVCLKLILGHCIRNAQVLKLLNTYFWGWRLRIHIILRCFSGKFTGTQVQSSRSKALGGHCSHLTCFLGRCSRLSIQGQQDARGDWSQTGQGPCAEP